MKISKIIFYQYLPGLCIIFSTFLSILTGINSIAYISIFYWSVFRADLVPISLLLGMGLFQDTFCSHFLGEETLLYLTLMGIVYLDRRFLLHRDFNYLWKNFAILTTVISIGKLMLAYKLSLAFYVAHQAYDLVVGILVFPLYVRLVAPLYSRFSTL